ncbi:MAG: hypothetical protein HQL22_08485, partial [Candidatus Omnitrophica bacterium]|nr:hypothetical protein [Candidatus Omnitrophota bacterium]
GQKTVCVLNGYRLPVPWKGEFCIYEPRGQALLRILPVIYMSLAVALIFLYFAWRVSTGFGLLGLAVTLSGFSVWAFLAEARPYSLWFLLCALAGMAFIEILSGKNSNLRWPWVSLAVINALLALTIFFSAIPLLAMSAVLLLNKKREYWRHAFRVTIVPLALCLAYYFLAKKTYPGLSQASGGLAAVVKSGLAQLSPGMFVARQDLLLTNIPPYWLVYMAAGIVAIGVVSAGIKSAARCEGEAAIFKGLLTALVLMLLASAAVIVWFLGWQANGNFAVAERYFLYLTPFSILLILAIVRNLWALAADDRWWRLSVIASITGMLALTSLWTYIHLMKWGPFWSL